MTKITHYSVEQHYLAAEGILEAVNQSQGEDITDDGFRYNLENSLRMAQIHATLATVGNWNAMNEDHRDLADTDFKSASTYEEFGANPDDYKGIND